MPSTPLSSPQILIIGNVGLDEFPQTGEKRLGGATYNQANQLSNVCSVPLCFLARVGQDEAGRRILDELSTQPFAQNLIVQDPLHPSSVVTVTLSPKGLPTYGSSDTVAADFLCDADFAPLRHQTFALISVGSKLLRSAQSRKAVFTYLDTQPNTPVFWDANLRKGYVTPETLVLILERATFVKLNVAELSLLANELNLQGTTDAQLATLSTRFHLSMVALTRGEKGAKLWANDQIFKAEGHALSTTNTVGAGDAFSAMMIHGILQGWSPQALVNKANSFAASYLETARKS